LTHAVPSPNNYLVIVKSLPRVARNQRQRRVIYPLQTSKRYQQEINMTRTLTAGIAAAALAATTFSAPSAQAYPVWVIPAIIAAGVGGIAIGGAATAANRPYAYDPAPGGEVYVTPHTAAACHIVRERTASGWRRVQVCD
jgi:hypothetical protein